MSSSKIDYVHFVASIKRSLALNKALDHKFYEMLKNIQEKDWIGRIVVEKDYLDEDRLDASQICLFTKNHSYVFEDGLVRFASEKYSLSNKSLSNRLVHLTNYSINRKSSSYTSNEDENSCQGHKWTLKSFWTCMTNSGINVEGIQEAITDMIIKTVICFSDAKTKSGLERIINVWEERSIYDSIVTSGLQSAMKVESPPITTVKKSDSHIGMPKHEPSEKKAKSFW